MFIVMNTMSMISRNSRHVYCNEHNEYDIAMTNATFDPFSARVALELKHCYTPRKNDTDSDRPNTTVT